MKITDRRGYLALTAFVVTGIVFFVVVLGLVGRSRDNNSPSVEGMPLESSQAK